MAQNLDQKDIELIRMLKGKNMDDSSIAAAMKMTIDEVQHAINSIYSNIDPMMEILFTVDTYNAMIGDLSFLSLQIQEKYKDKSGKTIEPISEKDVKLIMELNSKKSKLNIEKIKLLENISENKGSRKQYSMSAFSEKNQSINPISSDNLPKIKHKIRPKELYSYIYKTLNWLMLEQKNMKQFKKQIKKKKYYSKLLKASQAPNEQTFDDVILCIKMRKLPKPTGNVEKHLHKYWSELS